MSATSRYLRRRDADIRRGRLRDQNPTRYYRLQIITCTIVFLAVSVLLMVVI